MIRISFQPDLLAIMNSFSQFDEALKKRIATATEKSGPTIGDAIVAHMPPWNSGDGTFNNSFEMQVFDEFTADIGSAEPYGPRLNWGFDGPDSLGRIYHQEGTFFMEATVDDESTLLDVASNYIEAIYGAWADVVGGIPAGTGAFVGMA